MKLNQFKFRILVILFFTFIITPINLVFAQQDHPVGKVIAIRGNVTARGVDSNLRNLLLKAPIFLHDTIETNQGRVQLMFKDNTLITLGRNTQMEITKYVWNPGDTNSVMETKIHEGSFRIMGGAITRIAPHNFKTHSSSGTIGIRGSMYAGILRDFLLTVLFQGGKGIYVKNDAGYVNIRRPGFGTKVKGNTIAPENPYKFASNEIAKIDNALGATPEKKPLYNNESNDDPKASPPEPASSQSDPPANVDPFVTDPDPVDTIPPESSGGFSSPTDGSVLDSTQTSLFSSLTPTSTQQIILSMLLDLGFTGSNSTTIPGSGIWVYAGISTNTLVNETPEGMKFIVNWDNNRIMAFEDNINDPNKVGNGFGFGNVNADGSISNINIFGSGGDDSSGVPIVTAFTGSETFGHFYGPSQQGLDLAIEGFDYNVQDQSELKKKFWSDITAGTLKEKKLNLNFGTEPWKGFYVGVAEDMGDPNNNRRIFYNDNPGDFLLNVNKDNGTIAGTMSGKDFNNVTNLITGLTIGGGSNESAYISNKTIGASLKGNNVITIAPLTTGLKPHGNYMVNSRKPMLSNHTTWGYWEIAYTEPGTGRDYHLHIPGAKWIAGKQTLAAVVDNKIAASFTGKYLGKAEGVMFNNVTQMSEMTKGKTDLDLDFAPGALKPVSGKISFDQINLPVTSAVGDLNNLGFKATISTAAQSNINGGFYGPDIQAIGGNFSARMPDGMHYHGIFAGDLQP